MSVPANTAPLTETSNLREDAARIVSRLHAITERLENVVGHVHGIDPPQSPASPPTVEPAGTPAVASSISLSHSWLRDVENAVSRLEKNL